MDIVLSDSEFELQFAHGSLAPELFTHEAHLRLAWIQLKKYGHEQALANVCGQIRNFDELHGDGTKFHLTLSQAAVRAVEHFRRKSKSDNFQDFLEEFPQLMSRFMELILSHYSAEVLFSDRAKFAYVAPDIEAFD